MIFKRKIYEELLQWKRTDEGRTAVLIQGARRIGKSTVAEEFAKNEYETYFGGLCSLFFRNQGSFQ